MADKSQIEWTEATWNPVVGCSILSPGCTNCYAMKMARRIEGMQPSSHYAGTTKGSKAGAVWTGKLALAPDHILTQPLRWKRARTIFVNSMGDLFHENVPDEWIDRVFAIMALAPQHTFQVLTKRAGRMRVYMGDRAAVRRIYSLVCDLVCNRVADGILIAPGVDPAVAPPGRRVFLGRWPLPNVWLGVSTERQQEADERIPDLLVTPAAVRFISAEPLLGPIDLAAAMSTPKSLRVLFDKQAAGILKDERGSLHWVIVGGESGPGARPMHPAWARSLRDQCAAAGVPFFFKQWGEWGYFNRELGPRDARDAMFYGPNAEDGPLPYPMYQVGKKAAGRLLDGVEHNAMPGAA